MALLHLFNFTSVRFLSAPDTAKKCRAEIENLLIYHKEIEIDFANVYVTIGFLEHLLTPLLKEQGSTLLSRLFFANCSEPAESNINEVVKYFREISLSND